MRRKCKFIPGAMMVLFVVTFGMSSKAHSQPDIDKWNVVLDYMVQDVCIGPDNQVLIGISPIDDKGRCKQRRNLLPGEKLPYHKHDWPGNADMKRLSNGYERNDSFPYVSKAIGFLVIQTFDFGNGDRNFGKFDKGDGGQVVAFSKDTASIILTEDGGRGLQLMAGPKCRSGNVAPSLLNDSWLIADKRAEHMESGVSVAKLRIVTTPACPSAFDSSYTEWHFVDYSYRSSLAGTVSKPLSTLVSSHFGGTNPTVADALERFYFTRELGWTRWERWQNVKYSKDPARDVKISEQMKESGRCEVLEPAPAEGWVMKDCREWTNIAPPDVGGGDKPDFWIDRLIKYPLSRPIFVK